MSIVIKYILDRFTDIRWHQWDKLCYSSLAVHLSIWSHCHGNELGFEFKVHGLSTSSYHLVNWLQNNIQDLIFRHSWPKVLHCQLSFSLKCNQTSWQTAFILNRMLKLLKGHYQHTKFTWMCVCVDWVAELRVCSGTASCAAAGTLQEAAPHKHHGCITWKDQLPPIVRLNLAEYNRDALRYNSLLPSNKGALFIATSLCRGTGRGGGGERGEGGRERERKSCCWIIYWLVFVVVSSVWFSKLVVSMTDYRVAA